MLQIKSFYISNFEVILNVFASIVQNELSKYRSYSPNELRAIILNVKLYGIDFYYN